MKLLDLPAEEIKWFIDELKIIERKAYLRGYLNTVILLDEGKIITALLEDK